MADDLSGALEAGSVFHSAGRRVGVPLHAGDRLEDFESKGVDLIVVDTESRHGDPDETRRRVAASLDALGRSGSRLVYKKIDSTLRGWLGGEIAEILGRRSETRVLLNPANPAAGRSVVAGRLLVRGVPVHETDFARDPLWPVRDADVAAVLARDCSARIERLPLEVVRSGAAACRAAMVRAFEAGARVLVADGESAADLETLARAARDFENLLPVGSGGLARAVARVASETGGPQPDAGADTPPPAAGLALFVVGSAHPINREQALALGAARGVGVETLRVYADLGPEADDPALAERCAERLLRAANPAGGAVLLLDQSGVGTAVAPERLLRLLAGIAGALDARRTVNRLFLTGGETARSVAGRLGAGFLRIEAEIESGLVGALAPAEAGTPARLLATKPGGFGDAQTMIRAWDWLSRRPNTTDRKTQ
jgi:uncharacterized protein YgbK (DUF1537 family)